jgi:hypothetical protein
MGFLETGRRGPRLDTLMSVAEGMIISVDELLKGCTTRRGCSRTLCCSVVLLDNPVHAVAHFAAQGRVALS